jgi:putative GTP pyrophosphokinase
MLLSGDREKKKHVKKILREYSSKFELYDDFAASVRRLMFLFLKAAQINFHSINYRAKDVYSLKQKIKRKMVKGRIYAGLNEISDLAGVRVILYFKSDIPKVVDIINREFLVHEEENVDRNRVDDSEQSSGYTAIHRVVSLNREREALKEYSHFAGLKCEIQIRTVLQHAWSEIEHGIGYKPAFNENSAAKKKIKKLFRLIAKQLEAADANFVQIHDSHNELLKKYLGKINKRKMNVAINAESIESYFLKKENFQKIPEAKKNLLILEYLELAKTAQLKTIKELDELLSKQIANG